MCYHKIGYQNELLNKVFKFQNQLSALEELDIVHQYELTKSYVYLIQYIYNIK